MKEEFEPGNHWAKLKVIILLILAAFFYFSSEHITNYFITEDIDLLRSNPDLAIKENLDGLLAWTIITSFLYVLVSIYFVYLGIKVRRDGRWPPTGMKMAFKTKVRRGRYARVVSMFFIFAAVIILANPVVNFYAWYSLSKTIQIFSQ